MIETAKHKIGVVVGRFNRPITEKLQSGALDRLKEVGVEESNIFLFEVPGAVEIPLVCKELLEKGVDAVLALGCVIRGETTHYDYVCNSVERGITKLILDYSKPIAFGVLTTENKEQALARSGGKKGNKGAEAVDVVLEMLEHQARLKKLDIK